MQLSPTLPARALVIPFPLRPTLPRAGARPFTPSTPDAASDAIRLNAARVLGITARSWWPAN